ncbi:hypothetical protein QR680_013100 [Steinernema hermaphroditum]|uniref:Peptidase S1 domain-containing protein n=1 Tax=Steinernema hermaphroditum TaxID=289476 RepID=A0AA39M1Q8_9BILA|nr:hypothetical protein QR680_013100 [Steinernema hermaphroditum]
MDRLAVGLLLLGLVSAIALPPEAKCSEVVIGGSPAALGQFPFYARLRISRKFYVGVCGAALLSEHFLLTAAHCVSGGALFTEDFEAFLGLVDLNARFRKSAQRSRVVEVIFPPGNPSGNIAIGDIAVLRLETPLNFTKTVQPTKIVREDEELLNAPEGVLVGFGRTTWKDDASSATDDLLFAEVPLVDQKFCRSVHGKRITEKDFCAGGDGKGQALGDSGGPFGVYRNGEWIQLGLPSQGFATDKKKMKPSILTRVSAYCDFIESASEKTFLLHPAVMGNCCSCGQPEEAARPSIGSGATPSEVDNGTTPTEGSAPSGIGHGVNPN